MDHDSLHMSLDYVGSSGVTLSVEQKSALQSSLVILKTQQKFEKVKFFGKIHGVRRDYIIVQGVGKDELKERKTLFSVDCLKWGLAPTPSDEVRRKVALVKGRFTGDPSFEYEIEAKGLNNPDANEDEMIVVKEEDRLACVIESICRDAMIVPRGAFLRMPTGEVVQNRTFEGLSVAESTRLSSYYHFRDPILLHETSLLEKADLDKAMDFLDPIDTDIPQEGSWSVQTEHGSGLVVIRSLHWLGYTFYHCPGTSRFGFVYFGTGEKNLDLPFMLN